MKYHRLILLGVVGIMSVLTIGCASNKKVVLTDQQIADNIKMALEAPNGPAGPFGIDIFVHKGSVTLDGEVASQASKEAALGTAQAQEGVKDVKSFVIVN